MLISTYLGDYLQQKKPNSVRVIRSGSMFVYCLVALYPSLLFFMPKPMLQKNYAMILLSILRGLRGFSFSSYYATMKDISPTFSTNIFTLSTIIGCLPGILVPLLKPRSDHSQLFQFPF